MDWIEALPNSQLSILFLGVSYIHQASLDRGNLPADSLSSEQEELFIDS